MRRELNGRDSDAGRWIKRTPRHTLMAVIAAIGIGLVAGAIEYRFCLTPLMRGYLPQYISSGMSGRWGHAVNSYQIYAIRGTDVLVPIVVPKVYADWTPVDWTGRHMHDVLYAQIYGWSLTALAYGPLAAFGAALLFGLRIGIPMDMRRNTDRRIGVRLGGAELLTNRSFEKRNGGGAIQIQQVSGRGIHEKPVASLTLPLNRENVNISVMGDARMGKSAFLRLLLMEIAKTDDAVWFWDLHGEFANQFYRDGHTILNYLDARTPYTSPALEGLTDLEAFAVSASLFAESGDHKEDFFIKSARNIMNRLLRMKGVNGQPVSPQELEFWISHPEYMAAALHGTGFESYVSPKSGQQMTATVSTLAHILPLLRLMPAPDQVDGFFSTPAWEQHGRQGWVWVTTRVNLMDSMRPALTMWLDSLVNRLMSVTPEEAMQKPRTWIIVEEAASLGRTSLEWALPQLGKFNVQVVLCFQSLGQFKKIYGDAAMAMLSQMGVKVFFRTSEFDGAKWVSDTLATVETERVNESRDNRLLKRDVKYNLIRENDPAVRPATIQGLDVRHGYVKVGNCIAPLHIPYVTLPSVVPAFVARPMPTTLYDMPQMVQSEKPKDKNHSEKPTPKRGRRTETGRQIALAVLDQAAGNEPKGFVE